ncbi:50S ribosome-binding GTPase [Candidatus Micrarchaeota archaeon]|nr:50S ribosome-binding GTPase [Candidatus Micrarchaeota archaeon]
MGLWYHTLKAIKESNIVLEILDARLPELTRHFALEQKILRHRKKLVIVLNKSDLISKKTALTHKKELEKVAPTIFVSSKHKKGIARLKKQVRQLMGKKPAVIAIIGYPNTGKSTILNALAGRKAAKTSSQAGFTRGRQLVKLFEDQYLMDSPGVIPFEQRNKFELALIGSKNPNQLKDKEGVALQLAAWIQEHNAQALQETYGVKWPGDSETFLEELAQKKGRLIKGGKADWNAISTLLILDWQKGKITI